MGAAVRRSLYRPLAEDDGRVAYWVHHVRLGVLLTEVAALAAVGYALFTPTPGRMHPVLLAAAALAILGSPLVLLLPLPAMMRDARGPVLFYAWSGATTVLVVVGTRMDGGADSALIVLLFLTLGFMSAAFQPAGVVAMGSVMVVSYLVVDVLPQPSTAGLFVAVVMAAFTMLCAMASANQWEAYDRLTLLLRTHETLAATDPLTGCLNRRAFLDRLHAAIGGAAEESTVVCLVDLDGFKAVNDRDGHAAGDAVLRSVTTALAAAVRETDTVARLGGDEFAVLAAVPEPGDATRLAERIREGIARVGRSVGVTASVGLTVVRAGDDDHEVLLRADQAMYRAKAAGGNRIGGPPSAVRFDGASVDHSV
ncbi:GGDEF domain-containing protein [Trujillonella endophytica]|uniref:Diguanylate cyclase (GGDEF) domain-containing protein n=1 Tax=Trujillonella endophytica TaxID=673521 RepID=A0A1H8VSJ3_9ACTN|nr:GGDEF domain-containing protein [Trujillella endophytica]SEP18389.1 diguanylate cyclase (GGDEF) domain-containing protein [Trujillella endophytica]